MPSLRCVPRIRVSAIFLVFFCPLLTCLLSTPALAQNENETVGFSSTHIFDGGYAGENIDTLNGGLTFTVPIGPSYQVNKNLSYQLKLVYNSRVWEIIDGGGSAIKGKLIGEGPFGLGFTLSLGRVYQDKIWNNVSTPADYEYRWYFVTPDGGKHDLGANELAPSSSNDLTYYTARMSGSTIVITDRTGIRYTLGHRVSVLPNLTDIPIPCMDGSSIWPYASCDPDWREKNAAFGGWYVTRIEDMTSGPESGGLYPNWVKVEYEDADTPGLTKLGYGQCIKYVKDSLLRTITFTNSLQVAGEPRSARTTQIAFPKFANGGPVNNSLVANYNLTYESPMPTVFLPVIGYQAKRTALRLNLLELPPPVAGGLRPRVAFYYTPGGSELTARTLPMNDAERVNDFETPARRI